MDVDDARCDVQALDTDDLETALSWAAATGPYVSTVKVGLALFLRHGGDAVRKARQASGGRDVFLDLKLHDIPNTVAKAVQALRPLEPALLTVHAGGGRAMMEDAKAAAANGTKVVAVTMLTSLDERAATVDARMSGVGASSIVRSSDSRKHCSARPRAAACLVAGLDGEDCVFISPALSPGA